MNNNRYISRYEYKGLQGYYVRVPDGKVLKQKLFNANKYGGMRETKKQAIAFRDEFLEKTGQLELLKKFVYRRLPFRKHSRGSEMTPAIGVNLARTEKDNGNTYWGWTARFMENDKQRVRYFSVDKWGYDRAFKEACKIRYENCGDLYVHNKADLPCKPPVPYKLIK